MKTIGNVTFVGNDQLITLSMKKKKTIQNASHTSERSYFI